MLSSFALLSWSMPKILNVFESMNITAAITTKEIASQRSCGIEPGSVVRKMSVKKVSRTTIINAM